MSLQKYFFSEKIGKILFFISVVCDIFVFSLDITIRGDSISKRRQGAPSQIEIMVILDHLVTWMKSHAGHIARLSLTEQPPI